MNQTAIVILTTAVLTCASCSKDTFHGDDFPNCDDGCGDGILECDFRIKDFSDIELLSSCDTIEGFLSIKDSDLTSLDGLNQLRQVKKEVIIVGNSKLVSILGLSGLEVLGETSQTEGNRGMLQIEGNNSLPNCKATGLRDRLMNEGWLGTACIQNNLDDECGEDWDEEECD